MTIPQEIREVLACPKCHGPLEDVTNAVALECPSCELRFPIRDGIPILLLDSAERRVR